MPRRRNAKKTGLSLQELGNGPSTDLQRGRWRVDWINSYYAGQAKFFHDTGELPPTPLGDYKLLAQIVLTANCADCGHNIARLYISKSTPWHSYVELARYAYWVPKANSRCAHKGQLPHPEELVEELTAALGTNKARNFRSSPSTETRGRVKVNPDHS